MYAMPPYPYLATDYSTQLSLFTHHVWIGGFCIVGAGAHAAIFMVRDYDPTNNYNNLLDRVIRHRDAIISHLNWVSIFLGFHSFGLYIHNDTMSALGRPQDMFSDTAIQLQPVFAQWIQNTHFLAPQLTAPNALAATSLSWGGDVVAVGGKVAMMPISLGTADFLVWLMLDQVKLRYMLEQPVIFSMFVDLNKAFSGLGMDQLFSYRKVFNFEYQSSSHWLKTVWFIFANFGFFVQGHKNSALNKKILSPKQVLGSMENLVGRANQQVTLSRCKAKASKKGFAILSSVNQEEGTSETTREAVSSPMFDFSDYVNHKPKQIKHVDDAFLTWFIGFIEGDGSYWSRDTNVGSKFTFDNDSKRGEFEITQHIDNIKLLHYIRSNLGFGRVNTFEKEGRQYCRWYTSEKTNIIRLIYILNGNLVLEKRREQFHEWVNLLSPAWQLNICLKPFNSTVSLKNGWLAGFADADAGFYTNVGTTFKGASKPTGGNYVKFITKFYITQKDETPVLLKILNLVGSPNKLSTITNGITTTRYNRMEINKEECIEKLLQYFSKFPLKGARKIDCLRWARVHAYKTCHVVATETAAKKLARLLLTLQEPSTDLPLNIFSQQFNKEETEIFNELPLGQRNPNYQSRDLRRRNLKSKPSQSN
jgi:hypothetical protein